MIFYNKKIYIFIFLFALSGCALMFKSKVKDFYRLFEQGAYFQAGQVAEKHAKKSLYWSLQSGNSFFNAQAYDKSILFYDHAEYYMQVKDTLSFTEKLIEWNKMIFLNNYANEYDYTNYDAIMVNVHKGWSYWYQDRLDEARVEFSRAEERQKRSVEYFSSEILSQSVDDSNLQKLLEKNLQKNEKLQMELQKQKHNPWQKYDGYVNTFSSFSQGLFFLLTGEAQSDIEKSIFQFKRLLELYPSDTLKKALSLAEKKVTARQPVVGTVWFIIEDGQSVEKKELDITLPFLIDDDWKILSLVLPQLQKTTSSNNHILIDGQRPDLLMSVDNFIINEFNKGNEYRFFTALTQSVVKLLIQTRADDISTALYTIFSQHADVRTIYGYPQSYLIKMVSIEDKKDIKIQLNGMEVDVPLSIEDKKSNYIVDIKLLNNASSYIMKIFMVE